METRWEYAIITLHSGREAAEKQLNNLGHAFWELVHVRADLAYMKRPIPQPQPGGIAADVLEIGRKLKGQ